MKNFYLDYLKDNDIITLEDGFRYLDTTDMVGAIPSHTLREIADYLDEVNKPWQDNIDEYFEALQSEHGRVLETEKKETI